MAFSPVWFLLLLVAGLLWWGWRRLMRWFEANGRDIWGSRVFFRLDGANRLFCRRYHRLQHDPIVLPKEGGAVLVANHISGLDPFLLGAATDRALHFLVAREEYERFGTRWFFKGAHSIPVDRSTRPARAFRAALEALSRGEVIAVFPHGGIIQEGEREKPLKSGALRMAQLAEVPLIPVHISGVAAPGTVIGSLLPRSHARIVTYAPMPCGELKTKDCLQVLTALFRGRPDEVDCPGYDPVVDTIAGKARSEVRP